MKVISQNINKGDTMNNRKWETPSATVNWFLKNIMAEFGEDAMWKIRKRYVRMFDIK